MSAGDELSKLVSVDPRTVWPHEAQDFTPWLLANADTLAEVLGVELELTANEHPVGNFSLDLIGKDLTNDCVLIIENQLTATDHSHLGQLLTYAAGTDAATIVWMAPEFREEHRQALDYLNTIGGESARFFGVSIGAVRIGDSLPAPLFQLVAEPNDWHAQVAQVTQAAISTGSKGAHYLSFWTRFLERIHAEHPGWTRARKSGPANWFNVHSPRPGVVYVASFPQGGKLRVEVYIDTGDADENLAIFRFLAAQRSAIESEVGEALSWEELPGKRACRIAVYGQGDVAETTQHDGYLDWMLDRLGRFRRVFTARFADYSPTNSMTPEAAAPIDL